jgi:hypothetical protein
MFWQQCAALKNHTEGSEALQSVFLFPLWEPKSTQHYLPLTNFGQLIAECLFSVQKIWKKLRKLQNVHCEKWGPFFGGQPSRNMWALKIIEKTLVHTLLHVLDSRLDIIDRLGNQFHSLSPCLYGVYPSPVTPGPFCAWSTSVSYHTYYLFIPSLTLLHVVVFIQGGSLYSVPYSGSWFRRSRRTHSFNLDSHRRTRWCSATAALYRPRGLGIKWSFVHWMFGHWGPSHAPLLYSRKEWIMMTLWKNPRIQLSFSPQWLERGPDGILPPWPGEAVLHVGLSLICAPRRIFDYTTGERNVDHVDLIKLFLCWEK